MSDSLGGDSAQVNPDNLIKDAFGIPTSGEAATEINSHIPDNQESDTAQDDGTPVKEEPSQDANIKVIQRQADEARRMVIDSVEREFKKLAKGEVDAQELKDFFQEHPEIAKVANQSKRVKDAYRSLIESAPTVANEEDQEETSPDKNGLTLEQLQKVLDERELKQSERFLKAERDTLAETFASQRNIVDGEYDKLTATANVLAQSNPDWTYKQSLEAAQRALFPQKNKPVQPEQGNSISHIKGKEDEQKVDLTKGHVFTEFFPK